MFDFFMIYFSNLIILIAYNLFFYSKNNRRNNIRYLIISIIVLFLINLIGNSFYLNMEEIILFIMLCIFTFIINKNITEILFKISTIIFVDIFLNRLSRKILLYTVIHVEESGSELWFLLYMIGYSFIFLLIISIIKFKIYPIFVKNKYFSFYAYLESLVLLIYLSYKLFRVTIDASPDLEIKNEVITLTLVFLLVFQAIGGVFYVYNIHKTNKITLKMKEKDLEQKISILYAEEADRQYKNIRKFKHDYVNILNSLKYYIEDGNIEDLSSYFEKEVLPTGNNLKGKDKRLNDLNNIQALEIKSLFLSKLSLNPDIRYSLEIPKEVLTGGLDNSLNIVRILGIFLDNAIEEVKEHGGSIDIGFLPQGNSTLIVIVNDFLDRKIPLYKLQEEGYSNKGENRGLGLSNVNTLVDESENLSLNTRINDGKFIQELTITGG